MEHRSVQLKLYDDILRPLLVEIKKKQKHKNKLSHSLRLKVHKIYIKKKSKTNVLDKKTVSQHFCVCKRWRRRFLSPTGKHCVSDVI